MNGWAVGIGPIIICVSPAPNAAMAGPPPLYATCVSFTPASVAKYSAARKELLPSPADEKLTAPGFAFAYLMSSATDVAGTDALTESRFG